MFDPKILHSDKMNRILLAQELMAWQSAYEEKNVLPELQILRVRLSELNLQYLIPSCFDGSINKNKLTPLDAYTKLAAFSGIVGYYAHLYVPAYAALIFAIRQSRDSDKTRIPFLVIYYVGKLLKDGQNYWKYVIAEAVASNHPLICAYILSVAAIRGENTLINQQIQLGVNPNKITNELWPLIYRFCQLMRMGNLDVFDLNISLPATFGAVAAKLGRVSNNYGSSNIWYYNSAAQVLGKQLQTPLFWLKADPHQKRVPNFHLPGPLTNLYYIDSSVINEVNQIYDYVISHYDADTNRENYLQCLNILRGKDFYSSKVLDADATDYAQLLIYACAVGYSGAIEQLLPLIGDIDVVQTIVSDIVYDVNSLLIMPPRLAANYYPNIWRLGYAIDYHLALQEYSKEYPVDELIYNDYILGSDEPGNRVGLDVSQERMFRGDRKGSTPYVELSFSDELFVPESYEEISLGEKVGQSSSQKEEIRALAVHDQINKFYHELLSP